MVTPKYRNYLTVSFPPMVIDLINEHCYQTGITKQDLVRIAVRNMLTTKLDKDMELVILDRLRQQEKLR